MNNLKIWFILIGGLILITAIIFTNVSNLFNSNALDYDSEAEVIKIPLSEISENAKWYEYDSNGVNVRFFAVKANDGSIKTAFDACDVCYKFKKGYRQEGSYMVCNNCGNKYPISSLGSENIRGGGCWPGYLPNSIESDNLIIKKSDLENGRWRFS